MRTKLSLFALVAASVATTLSTPVVAQDAVISQAAVVQDSGASERIAYSGKLRMLSQRIPSAACHFAAGVDPAATARDLAEATDYFEQILHALEFGDTSLGIDAPETRRKTLTRIAELRDVWAPFKAAADGVVLGQDTDANLNVLLGENLHLLETAATLVIEISGQYANPAEIVQADAFLLDVAGRQRMLLKQIAKESCMVAYQGAPADALSGSMQIFASSLEALRHGMPSAGLRKPPTKEISAGLDGVATGWTDLAPTLEMIAAGTELDVDAAAQNFHGLAALMDEMHAVVGLYAEATKNEL